jgi:hypothetical protein
MNRHRDLNVQHFICSDYNGGVGMVKEKRFNASQEHGLLLGQLENYAKLW